MLYIMRYAVQVLESLYACQILLFLREQEKVHLTKLAADLGANFKTIQLRIDEMYRAGLIELNPDIEPPRRVNVTLTQFGEEVAESLTTVEKVLSRSHIN